MGDLSVESLKSNLQTLETQLSQIVELKKLQPDSTDFDDIEKQLRQAKSLTEQSILDLKKSELIGKLENDAIFLDSDEDGATTSSSSTPRTPSPTPKQNHSSSTSLTRNVRLHSRSSALPSQIISSSSTSSSSSSPSALFRIGAICEAERESKWYLAKIIKKHPQTNKYTIVFLTPRTSDMKTCKFLDSGRCRFGSRFCNFSHGFEVEAQQTRKLPYELPDLRNGSRCMALYRPEGLWYESTILQITDDLYMVQYDGFDDTEVLKRMEVYGLPKCKDSKLNFPTSTKRSSSKQVHYLSDSDSETLSSTDLEFKTAAIDFCDWSNHTTGFGLKMLTRMGYKFGHGLGKSLKGMVDPIEIRKIPTNTSLDFLDPDNLPPTKPGTGKSARRRKRKREKEEKEKAKKQKEKAQQYPKKHKNVFEFLNSVTTSGSSRVDENGTPRSSGSSAASPRSVQQGMERNDLVKLGDNIGLMEKKCGKYRESLQRHLNGRDPQLKELYARKLAQAEQTLRNMKRQRSSMNKYLKEKDESMSNFRF